MSLWVESRPTAAPGVAPKLHALLEGNLTLELREIVCDLKPRRLRLYEHVQDRLDLNPGIECSGRYLDERNPRTAVWHRSTAAAAERPDTTPSSSEVGYQVSA